MRVRRGRFQYFLEVVSRQPDFVSMLESWLPTNETLFVSTFAPTFPLAGAEIQLLHPTAWADRSGNRFIISGVFFHLQRYRVFWLQFSSGEWEIVQRGGGGDDSASRD